MKQLWKDDFIESVDYCDDVCYFCEYYDKSKDCCSGIKNEKQSAQNREEEVII